MFQGLSNLVEIDLSNFDASKVTAMNNMLSSCINLEKINFGKINTSSVQRMDYLFSNSAKLSSIDVSNFDTSSVTKMERMFAGCTSLTSIDVSNFDTKKVENMLDIFGYCDNLITANVSNFEATKLTMMQGMFYHCYKLKYLELSKFDTSSVSNMQLAFEDCNSLVYIKLNKLKIQGDDIFLNIFKRDSSILNICINDAETRNKLQSSTSDLNLNFDCAHKCFHDDIEIDLKTNECVENCDGGDFKYELNGLCYEICPSTSYAIKNNDHFCRDKSLEGHYYFDNVKNLYKECFKTCKKCSEGGNELNHKCDECISGFTFLTDSGKEGNCYKICQNYYYFDETNSYLCTEEKTCPTNFNKLIKEKNKCIDKCENDDTYKFEFNNTCYEQCPNGTNHTNNTCYEIYEPEVDEDLNIEKFKKNIFNDQIIKNILENKEDYIITKDNITFQITSTENQKINNNKTNNISTINLGKCENILREKYNIDESLPLIILKVDYNSPDTLIPIVEYEIYHPINKSKLDLAYCEILL